MMTHEIIQQEAEELGLILHEGGVEIPSMLSCMRPGIIVLLWLVACPSMAFNFLVESNLGDVYSAIGFSSFLGVILLFAITNGRSLYLSIPGGFRKRSVVLNFIKGKVQLYGVVYAVLIVIVSLFGAYSNMGSLAYLLPMMAVTVFMGFVFNMDIGRYRLSAFTTVMETFKGKATQR